LYLYFIPEKQQEIHVQTVRSPDISYLTATTSCTVSTALSCEHRNTTTHVGDRMSKMVGFFTFYRLPQKLLRALSLSLPLSISISLSISVAICSLQKCQSALYVIERYGCQEPADNATCQTPTCSSL
jgi:hypothetical protein